MKQISIAKGTTTRWLSRKDYQNEKRSQVSWDLGSDSTVWFLNRTKVWDLSWSLSTSYEEQDRNKPGAHTHTHREKHVGVCLSSCKAYLVLRTCRAYAAINDTDALLPHLYKMNKSFKVLAVMALSRYPISAIFLQSSIKWILKCFILMFLERYLFVKYFSCNLQSKVHHL